MSGLPSSISHPDMINTMTTAMERTNGFQIIFQLISCTNSKLKPTIVIPNNPDTAIMARNVLIRIPFRDKNVNIKRRTHATSKKSTGQNVKVLVFLGKLSFDIMCFFLKVGYNRF